MTIYSLDILLFLFGTSLLFHVQFLLLLPDLHTNFSRGRSGWSSSKKTSINKFRERCGQKGPLLYCLWECKLIQPLWRTVWRFLRKLGIKLPYDSAFPLLGIYPEKNYNSKRPIYANIHCSIIYNSQGVGHDWSNLAAAARHGNNLNVHRQMNK